MSLRSRSGLRRASSACDVSISPLSPLKRQTTPSTSASDSSNPDLVSYQLDAQKKARVDRRQKEKSTFGFRAGAAFAGSIPGTLLNLVVPVIAIYRGDVALPNVMLSDVMASNELYEAIYTWGFTLTMVAVCFVLRESSGYWRHELPSLAPDVDRFLFLLYAVCAPSLFGLVAFQYSHDMSFSSDASIKEVMYTLDFLLWSLHAFFTAIFFLGCCGLCYIYSRRLNPALLSKGLMHTTDRWWREFASNSCTFLLPVGVVVRVLHLVMGTTFYGVCLVLIEVAMIQLFILCAFLGVARLMMQLDAAEPMLNMSNLMK